MPLQQTAESFDFMTSVHGLVYRSMPLGQTAARVASSAAEWDRTVRAALAEWRRREGVRAKKEKAPVGPTTERGGGGGVGADTSAAPAGCCEASETNGGERRCRCELAAMAVLAERTRAALSLLTGFNAFARLQQQQANQPPSAVAAISGSGGSSDEAEAAATLAVHAVGESIVAAVEALVLWGALPRRLVSEWFVDVTATVATMSGSADGDGDDAKDGDDGAEGTASVAATKETAVLNASAAHLLFFWCQWQRSGLFSGVSALGSCGGGGGSSGKGAFHLASDAEAYGMGMEADCTSVTGEGEHHAPLCRSFSTAEWSRRLTRRALLLHCHSPAHLYFSPSPSDAAVGAFLGRYVATNGEDSSGYTPLHYAARGQGGGGSGGGSGCGPSSPVGVGAGGSSLSSQERANAFVALFCPIVGMPAPSHLRSSAAEKLRGALRDSLRRRIKYAAANLANDDGFSSPLLPLLLLEGGDGVVGVDLASDAYSSFERLAAAEAAGGSTTIAAAIPRDITRTPLAVAATFQCLDHFSKGAVANNATAPSPLESLEAAALSGGSANLFAYTPHGLQTALQRSAAQGRLAAVRLFIAVFAEVAGRVLLPLPQQSSPDGCESDSSSGGSYPSSPPAEAAAFRALWRQFVAGADSSGRSALRLAADECPSDGGLRDAILASLGSE